MEQRSDGIAADILTAMRDADPKVRAGAIDRLRDHAGLVAALRFARGRSAEEHSVSACDVDGADVLNALVTLTDDPSPHIRFAAILLLGEHCVASDAQAAIVRHLGTDPDGNVRMVCAAALSWTPATHMKVAALISALSDADDKVASHACLALGATGDLSGVAPLLHVLGHRSWNVRFRACQGILYLGFVDDRVLMAIEDLGRSVEAVAHDCDAEATNARVAEIDPDVPLTDTTSGLAARARSLAGRGLPF